MARSSKTQRDIDEIMAEMDGPSAPTPAGDVLEAVAVETTAGHDPAESAEVESGPSLEESFGAVRNLEAVMRIPVTIQVVLGSAIMPVANLMKLRRGSAIPLDHRVGEPVDVVVNGRTVARGEVVVVEDDTSRFGISLTEIVGGNASNA
ncbi:Flagellar motor switch protein FliN (modular protein) [uncultured Pleomorphomonas sp.]|nr:flagellar motor switch protein FliN [Pleomorphomonas carboxyditropha]SCM74909.1 Flagellar motor switch protein FliN (modular protein) [uncultured Pleomorphomonas sp.]